MTVPKDYSRSTEFLNELLLRVEEEAMLQTRHQAYTCLQAVLTVFRRRLTPEQVLRFAQILPPATASIFIDGWTPGEYTDTWGTRAALADEVHRFRQNHNMVTGSTIAEVARALRRTVGDAELDRALAPLGPEAQAYWAV